MDVACHGEKVGLVQSDGDVGGVGAESLHSEEELHSRFKLSSEEENLKGKNFLLKENPSKLFGPIWKPHHLEIQDRLLVGVEVRLPVLLQHHVLELRECEDVGGGVPGGGGGGGVQGAAGVVGAACLAQFYPQVVVERGGNLPVLVLGVAGAQDAVDGPLEGVRRGPDRSAIRQADLSSKKKLARMSGREISKLGNNSVTMFSECGLSLPSGEAAASLMSLSASASPGPALAATEAAALLSPQRRQWYTAAQTGAPS